jgi:ribosomal protein L7/L12
VGNNDSSWWFWFGVAVTAALLMLIFVRRRGGGPTSLRPPASTPALNKMEMINRYREQYGVSLSEAREAVEAQLRVEQPGAVRALEGPVVLSAEVEELARQGRKEDAVELYRKQTGASLEQAQKAVERVRT